MIARSLVLSLALLLGLCNVGFSGAWPREDGAVFVAGHVRQNTDNTEELPVIALYGEYGLNARWTLAAKLEYAFQQEEVSYAKLLGRWHFPDNGGSLRKALSFGVEGNKDELFLAPALHLGRGFETRAGAGWLDVELNAKVSTQTWDVGYGAFALVGLKSHRRVMTMMAVDLKTDQNKTQVNVIPSIAWQYTPGRQLHLEWTHALAGSDINELAAGLWLEF